MASPTAMVATNFVGQNTPAIAATEADYAEMWVQDAAAMYGYAASSSVATALTPFGEPPQTTNTGGQSAAAAQAVTGSTTGQAQTTLSELMAALPQQVQALAATADPSAASPWEWLAQLNSLVPAPVLTAFTDMNTFIFGPTQPFWQWVFTGGNIGSYSLAAKSDVESHLPKSPTPPKLPERLVGTGPGSAGMRGPVLVSVGQATSIGRLSVPPSWASATPADNPAAEPLASEGAGFRALPPWAANAPGGTPTAGMAPMANGEGRRTGNAVFRMRDRRFKMPRPAIGG
ncbi:PPE family protein [Mycobacterium malmoense]|uniref:PPE family protein n=1 Tax=Mycobacterium malmoense TaxID=1780 RepID=UPI0008F91E8D|nr:PPE domain-containing protein [Mycobacterium malmoense]OIN82868.1 hypothetical protein BMG05_00130 [Mycobacterium malmoense]